MKLPKFVLLFNLVPYGRKYWRELYLAKVCCKQILADLMLTDYNLVTQASFRQPPIIIPRQYSSHTVISCI